MTSAPKGEETQEALLDTMLYGRGYTRATYVDGVVRTIHIPIFEAEIEPRPSSTDEDKS